MSIASYRDLIGWQKSRQLVGIIYSLTRLWPREEQYGLTSQIRRAAVSVPSNIAEGHGRRSAREFHKFLHIAHGSLMEVETQLYIAFDLGYISQTQLDEALELSGETGRVIFGLIGSINKS